MMLFNGESEARQYLEKRVPPKKEKNDVDLTPLKKRLFEVPKELSPGHYEFEGKNGLKIIFDLLADTYSSTYHRCFSIFSEDDNVKGEYSPTYSINNLSIKTDNFYYDIKNHSKVNYIKWLPSLRNEESELSHTYADIDARHIYLIGQDGYFSKPIDFLGYFHELGHLEAHSPSNSTVKTTYSIEGMKTEPLKIAALGLQRERDANAWMLRNTGKLFEDLGIPHKLINDYVHHSQLESYHAINRKRLEANK